MPEYQLTINDESRVVQADPKTPLLYVLRQAGYVSVRLGCGLEQCGSCRIIVDGQLTFACTRPIEEVKDAKIETLEGLGCSDELHVLQQAFLDENAGQCGFCLSGIIMTAKILLEQNPKPSREDIQEALAVNLCRCGAHNRIIRAIQRAADKMMAS